MHYLVPENAPKGFSALISCQSAVRVNCIYSEEYAPYNGVEETFGGKRLSFTVEYTTINR